MPLEALRLVHLVLLDPAVQLVDVELVDFAMTLASSVVVHSDLQRNQSSASSATLSLLSSS
jgi:hypothetical protein